MRKTHRKAGLEPIQHGREGRNPNTTLVNEVLGPDQTALEGLNYYECECGTERFRPAPDPSQEAA